MSKKTKKIYIFIKERVKKMDRDRFLDFLCKDAIKIYLDKNQYFSSINNHENTAYCLISGVCALLRFTQNGEEIIYHYFKEKDVIGGVPLFMLHFYLLDLFHYMLLLVTQIHYQYFEYLLVLFEHFLLRLLLLLRLQHFQ